MHRRGVMRCTRLIDDSDESDGDESDDHKNANEDGQSFNGLLPAAAPLKFDPPRFTFGAKNDTTTTSGAQRSHTAAGRSIFSTTRSRFNTKSDNSNKDEDDCEIEDCVAPEESPRAASQQSKSSQELSQAPPSLTSTNTTSDCWKGKREVLIGMLKDDSSDIHLISGKNKTDKCRNIRNRYANNFEEKKVVDALLRLLRQKEKQEGPFAENNDESGDSSGNDGKLLWKKTSQPYSLLYKLRIHSHPPEKFSAEEIYKHHKIFHQYTLKEFEHYDKNMIELTNKHRARNESEVERWERHQLACSDRNISSRGKPIWYKHPARNQLLEDTRNGKTKQMKPKELHQTNAAYQDFPLNDFRKHVYEVKYSQLAGPYWQKKRNKIAMKEHKEAVDNLYEEWQAEKFRGDMDGLVEGLEAQSI